MNLLPRLVALILFAACGAAREPELRVVNMVCPRSGKPVAADSLTTYRARIVGFCNPHCRDDFAANVAARPEDRAFFDEAIDAPPRPR
jgi:hypothetical protein